MATQIPFNNQVATQASNRMAPAPGIWTAPSMYAGVPPVPLQMLRATASHRPPLQWKGRPAIMAGDWGTGALVGHVGGGLPAGTGLDNAVSFGASTAINQPAAAPGPSVIDTSRYGGQIFSTPVRETIGGVLA